MVTTVSMWRRTCGHRTPHMVTPQGMSADWPSHKRNVMMEAMNKFHEFGPPLDSDLLRTFLAVARHGNVTHASETIYRTQSAVSVQIKRLEERLGTRLFRREARGVSLTEAGERLQEAAGRIVRDLDRTATTFKRDPIEGTVRVGMPDDYGSDVLPGILSEFAARHSSVQVFVRCEFGTKFHKSVEQGELDLAVCAQAGTTAFFEEQTVWASARGFYIDETVPVPAGIIRPSLLVARCCYQRPATGRTALSNRLLERKLLWRKGSHICWTCGRCHFAQHG